MYCYAPYHAIYNSHGMEIPQISNNRRGDEYSVIRKNASLLFRKIRMELEELYQKTSLMCNTKKYKQGGKEL